MIQGKLHSMEKELGTYIARGAILNVVRWSRAFYHSRRRHTVTMRRSIPCDALGTADLTVTTGQYLLRIVIE